LKIYIISDTEKVRNYYRQLRLCTLHLTDCSPIQKYVYRLEEEEDIYLAQTMTEQ